MIRRRLLLAVALTLTLVLSAFAADEKVSVFRLSPPEKTARPKPKDVAVQGLNHKPAPAHALAVLRVESPGPRGLQKVDLRYWTDLLRPDAARLGANAVVGVHWFLDPDKKMYTASGLAVEFPDSARAVACRCVIAVARPTNASDAKDGVRKDDNESLQRLLGMELQRKGYFALVSESGFESRAAFPAASLASHLGVPVDLAFVSDLGFDHREGNVPVRLRGTLISMASGDTVWSSSMVDSLPGAPGTAGTIVTRAAQIERAVGKALGTLPAPPGVAE